MQKGVSELGVKLIDRTALHLIWATLRVGGLRKGGGG